MDSPFSLSPARGCTQMMQYTVLPMVSLYSTDLQVPVTRQDMQQYASKDREEEECLLVNTDVNNAGF